MVAATIAPPIHRSEYVARFYEGDDLLIPRLPKSTADVFELAVDNVGAARTLCVAHRTRQASSTSYGAEMSRCELSSTGPSAETIVVVSHKLSNDRAEDDGMVPALFMFAAASVGFGGHPWIAFAGGAFLMIAASAPEKIETLWRYKGEGVADVAIAMLLQMAMNVGGALVSAWAGYGFRQYLTFLWPRSQ